MPMMLLDNGTERRLPTEMIDADLAIVGGGIAGTCAAITAAREGLRVVLIQDRPVLGGNASSEVRLWMVGATSHLGNNNRWSREGGVLNEILLENTFRNRDGNPVLFDTILLDKVVAEKRIRLLLNTAVFETESAADRRITAVRAFNSQNSTRYTVRAPLFCDASGDGVVGFLAGAAFRVGAEARTEFGELLAAEQSTRELLGHSIYFYTRDTGHKVDYVPPSYALDDITKIPRFKRFNTKEQGTDLWWIEYGGSLDTVHETEHIKWELWKIIYGVWDHIKNSGRFDDADRLTLDWVGLIPGKRESRRFEGDSMLTQQDLVEQRTHSDAISYGGWAIDHHPTDNIYSDKEPCTQWHCKGVYQIPYRSMYSRNVPNLFLAGRLISASHIAFGSTRVMATCGHNAQAIAVAAAICREQDLLPRQIARGSEIRRLQTRLLRRGQYIPGVARVDPTDLAQHASITASSRLTSINLPPDRDSVLSESRALLFPAEAGQAPEVTFRVATTSPTTLDAELRVCSRENSFSPDVRLERCSIDLTSLSDDELDSGLAIVASETGSISTRSRAQRPSAAALDRPRVRQARFSSHGGSHLPSAVVRDVTVRFSEPIPQDQYAFVCLLANPAIRVAESSAALTGVTTVRHATNDKVARNTRQSPPPAIGVDAFEFWTPTRERRGRNLAARAIVSANAFAPENVANGIGRPTSSSNAWVASLSDPRPTLTLSWDQPHEIATIELVLDPDWDHPMENIVMKHAESVMPTLVRDLTIYADDDVSLLACSDNHLAIIRHEFDTPIVTRSLRVETRHPSESTPASVFEVRCYGRQ